MCEVLQVVSESRLWVRTQECRSRGDCWQIGGLTVSINSLCIYHGRLGEYTIRLGYASFLITIAVPIAFRRVGNTPQVLHIEIL